MSWAKAKESLTDFGIADSLYSLARENAAGTGRSLDEALVGTVLMYLEWGKADSIGKYLAIAEYACREHNDKENLSFVYTFKALSSMEDPTSMKKLLESAIFLAQDLINKNALFTAKYNLAVFYDQFNLQEQVRDISHRLTPLVIEKYGFRKAIEDIAYSINPSGKLKLETMIIGFETLGKYPVSLLNNLFWIVQELLHNILKHAQAGTAMLQLVEHDNHISVMVEDDGVGIDDYTAANGKGIKAIQSKIAYLNGQWRSRKKKIAVP